MNTLTDYRHTLHMSRPLHQLDAQSQNSQRPGALLEILQSFLARWPCEGLQSRPYHEELESLSCHVNVNVNVALQVRDSTSSKRHKIVDYCDDCRDANNICIYLVFTGPETLASHGEPDPRAFLSYMTQVCKTVIPLVKCYTDVSARHMG